MFCLFGTALPRGRGLEEMTSREVFSTSFSHYPLLLEMPVEFFS